MKRHPALISLAHDHHHALFVAQKLRRAEEDSAADARAAFLAFWRDEGERHFELEERILLPAYAGHGDPHHPLIASALCEHVDIRRRAGEIARDIPATAAALNELGERMADHVRLEERQLFPLIEQALPEDQLAAVAAALEQAHG